MGSANFRILESCVTLGSRLSSADFFEGLLVRRSSSAVEFYQGPNQITEFPSALNIEVTFLILSCSDRKPEKLDIAEEILKGLRFKVEWKRGLKVRPVSEFSSDITEPAAPKEGLRGPDTFLWKVHLTVKDVGVPLTDDLILTAFSKDGARLVRVAARL